MNVKKQLVAVFTEEASWRVGIVKSMLIEYQQQTSRYISIPRCFIETLEVTGYYKRNIILCLAIRF